MEDGSSWQLIIFFICLLLSALYSMSETALTSLSKIRIRSMQEEGVKGAEKLARLAENSNKLFTGLKVGNTLSHISAAALASAIVNAYIKNGSLSISIFVTSLLILIFGEAASKAIAAKNAEKTALALTGFVDFSIKLFSPITFVLGLITNGQNTPAGNGTNSETPIITEAEFKTLVEVGHEEGVFEQEEKNMINNVFDFSNADAEDIMVNRTDIIACKIDAGYDEIFGLFKEEGFTRIPVYEESIDNIVGILNFRDFMFNIENKDTFDIRKLLREPYFTYESKPIVELFSIMRNQRFSMAVILDEYGGTSGLITLEDIVEEIVGEIDDEYDEPEEDIINVGENEYVIEGATRLEDVNEHLGINLESEDFDTIGGYVIGLLGRFPEKDEAVEELPHRFVIEELDKNRIVKLRMFLAVVKEEVEESEENSDI